MNVEISEWRHVPVEMWVFAVGSLFYAFSPAVLDLPLFAIGSASWAASVGALLLAWGRRWVGYWFALGMAVWAAVDPWVRTSWRTRWGPPTRFQMAWVLGVPVALLLLWLSPRVIRFAFRRPPEEAAAGGGAESR